MIGWAIRIISNHLNWTLPALSPACTGIPGAGTSFAQGKGSVPRHVVGWRPTAELLALGADARWTWFQPQRHREVRFIPPKGNPAAERLYCRRFFRRALRFCPGS